MKFTRSSTISEVLMCSIQKWNKSKKSSNCLLNESDYYLSLTKEGEFLSNERLLKEFFSSSQGTLFFTPKPGSSFTPLIGKREVDRSAVKRNSFPLPGKKNSYSGMITLSPSTPKRNSSSYSMENITPLSGKLKMPASPSFTLATVRDSISKGNITSMGPSLKKAINTSSLASRRPIFKEAINKVINVN